MLTPERRDGIQRWAAKAGGFPGHAITDLLATIEALEAERDGWKAEAMWVAERLAAAAPELQAAQRGADARRWHRRASEGGSWDDFDASSREMDAAHDALAAAFAHCQPRSPATGARRTNRSPEEKP